MRNRISARTSVTSVGVDGSVEFHREKSRRMVKPLDRAVLVQTTEHYEQLRDRFPECEATLDASLAAFGEQLTMKGFDASVVCIGDVFASEDSPLKLQVSGPRLPCGRVDMRHRIGELPSGSTGTVRQFCAASGRAGVFFRVLVPGSVCEGDLFRRVRRGHQEWSVERVSLLCYPTTPVNLTFTGTKEMLEELCEMESLMVHEWRDRLQVARTTKALTAPGPPDTRSPDTRTPAAAGQGADPRDAAGVFRAFSAAAGGCLPASHLRALVMGSVGALGEKPNRWIAAVLGEKAGRVISSAPQ